MVDEIKNTTSVLEIILTLTFDSLKEQNKKKPFKDFLEEQLKPIAANFAYNYCNCNQTNASKLLGWNRGTFRKYFEKSLEIKRVSYGK